MQLSASSTLLDLLAASPAAPGQPAPTSAELPADSAAATGNFGALLLAQTKSAAAAPSATAANVLGGTMPTAQDATGEGSPMSLATGMVPAAGTLLPESSAQLSGQSALPNGPFTSPNPGANPAVAGAQPRATGTTKSSAASGSARGATREAAAPAVQAPRTAIPQAATGRSPDAGNIGSVPTDTPANPTERAEIGARLTGEITAAWLAANGPTVVVANPAGELISVEISLSATDIDGSILSGTAETNPAAATAAVRATSSMGIAAPASWAGNRLTSPEEASQRGLTPVGSRAQTLPGGTLVAPTGSESPATANQPGTRPSTSAGQPANSGVDIAPRAAAPLPAPATPPATSVPASFSADVPLTRVPPAASTIVQASAPAQSSEIPLEGAPASAMASASRPTDASSGEAPASPWMKGASLEPNPTATAQAAVGAISSVSHPARTAEKFAGERGDEADAPPMVHGGKQKNILTASVESLTNHSPGLGINAAKPEARMPALAHPTPSIFAENDPMSFATAPLTFDTLVQETGEMAPSEFTSSARRAVDSAMAVVDHFSRGTQRGVNLQFSVSGMDLAVRVEMRHDGVHTIFRTDSPELRQALAQEWQSVVNAQAADRSQRLAEPVFTSTSAGGPTSGEQGASQQRESGTPQSQWEKANAFAPPATSRAAMEAPHAPASNGPRLAPQGTARHLSALA